MLFHAKLCRACKERKTKKYFGIHAGVSFIYSSEEGLKIRKVIRTVKKRILDKEFLNEPKNAYIAGGYLKRFTFYFSDLVF